MSKTFTYVLFVIGVYILIVATGGNSSASEEKKTENSDKTGDNKKRQETPNYSDSVNVSVAESNERKTATRFGNNDMKNSYFNAYTR